MGWGIITGVLAGGQRVSRPRRGLHQEWHQGSQGHSSGAALGPVAAAALVAGVAAVAAVEGAYHWPVGASSAPHNQSAVAGAGESFVIRTHPIRHRRTTAGES